MGHGGRLTLLKSPLVSAKPAGSPRPFDSESGKNEMYMFETPEFQRVRQLLYICHTKKMTTDMTLA